MNGRLEKVFTVAATVWGFVRFLVARPRVIVFGTDMIGLHPYEPRMALVYQWLDTMEIGYVHLIHVRPHGHVIRHWFQRRRPVVYLEALERMSPSCLVWLLRASGARKLWAIDDYRNWPRVIAAARTVGLQTALFQHGRFSRHQAGTAFPVSEQEVLPDTYVVWNEYWRAKLLDLSPLFKTHPSTVRIGGKPSAETVVKRGNRVSSGGRLRVMLLHEQAASGEQVRALVDRLVALADIDLIYKVRDDHPAKAQLAHHGLSELMRTKRWVVTAELAPCDLALGSYSTLLYELIAADVPVGVLAFSSMQADDLVEDGLAASINPRASDLSGELQRAARISADELQHRAGELSVIVDIGDTLRDMLNP